MAVEKWTPERRRERTRAALVAAARQVFARRGFEGASLDEIAETAGYTRGAIYKHFHDKEELFWAVSDDMNADALSMFSEQSEEDQGLAFDGHAIAAAWESIFQKDADVLALSLEFRLYELRNPEVRERTAAHIQKTRETVTAFMRHYTEEGGITLKMPAETLTAIFLNAADGFNLWREYDPPGVNLFGTFLSSYLPAVMESDADAPSPEAEPTRAN